ncbi:hypothetical protein ACVWZZ_007593 [Bradyrhizobium sp. LM6.10]|jgi:hypothetical protein
MSALASYSDRLEQERRLSRGASAGLLDAQTERMAIM